MQTPFVEFTIRALDLVVNTTIAFVLGYAFITFVSGGRDNVFTQFFDKATAIPFSVVEAVTGGRARGPYARALVALVILFLARVALNQIYLAIFGLPAPA